jgi:hypothetical protein
MCTFAREFIGSTLKVKAIWNGMGKTHLSKSDNLERRFYSHFVVSFYFIHSFNAQQVAKHACSY